MSNLGFSNELREEIWSILMAILHLGNVEFKEVYSEIEENASAIADQ